MGKAKMSAMMRSWMVLVTLAVAAAGCTTQQAPPAPKMTPPSSAAQQDAASTFATPAQEEVKPAPKVADTSPRRTVSYGNSVCVDLDGLFNNDGIPSEANPYDADFDQFKNNYPWDGMPAGGKPFSPSQVEGLTFLFPDHSDGKMNNVACEQQELRFKPGTYRAIHFLGASETTDQEDTLTLLTGRSGEQQVPFKLTDWCLAIKYGEIPVLEWDYRIVESGDREPTPCKIFVQTITLEPGTTLRGLRLPQNPQMHIFGLTLQK